jgi:hypothetical protein
LSAHGADRVQQRRSDAWQWADDPRYRADKANLALGVGVNIAMYPMTR